MTENDENETEKMSSDNKEPDIDDKLKKAIGLGTLVFGIYLMDRLLGEEETVMTDDKKQLKIKKTFLDEILE